MKNISLLTLVAFFNILILHAQNNSPACHSTTAITEFARLADNSTFTSDHQTPKEYNYMGLGEMITFSCDDGKEGRGFFIKSPRTTDNFILVFQEWWGLNDNIKNYSEKLFNELGNVNVLAIDMYDGKITANADTARQLMQYFDDERGMTLVKGAIAFVGKKAKVGTIGWCFGGSWSLQAAIYNSREAGKRSSHLLWNA